MEMRTIRFKEPVIVVHSVVRKDCIFVDQKKLVFYLSDMVRLNGEGKCPPSGENLRLSSPQFLAGIQVFRLLQKIRDGFPLTAGGNDGTAMHSPHLHSSNLNVTRLGLIDNVQVLHVQNVGPTSFPDVGPIMSHAFL